MALPAALVAELSTLLGSGVGLSESFTTLLEATSHRGMKEALAQLNQSVRSGERFSAALDKSALKLPQYVYALSRAGEETGDPGTERRRRIARRIRSAGQAVRGGAHVRRPPPCTIAVSARITSTAPTRR